MLTAVAIIAASAVGRVRGSADEFQCACGHNARDLVNRLRARLRAGDPDEAVELATGYGSLTSRMLFVAYNRPEPTVGWLWLLHIYANTARELPRDPDRAGRMADALRLVGDELDRYMKLCETYGLAGDAAGWSAEELEKYVLERMTTVVRVSADDGGGTDVRESGFRPRWLYLNDVAANPDGPGRLAAGALARDAGISWGVAAGQLAHVYNLSKSNWLLGTRELVLYQKKFASAVAASMMGYVLVHVTHCHEHGRTPSGNLIVSVPGVGNPGAAETGEIGEYERAWMSVGHLVEKFGAYLNLGREKYYKTMLDVAANPVRDDGEFLQVKLAIRSAIAELGAGLFGPENQTPPAPPRPAGPATAQDEPPLFELIALVDNNIGAAEKYLKTVQDMLVDVDFRIVNDFMRSLHIWLT